MYAMKPIVDSTRPLEGVLARTMYELRGPLSLQHQQDSVESGSSVSDDDNKKCLVQKADVGISLETILKQITKVQKVRNFNIFVSILVFHV